ncbi:outer membrane beta-barrel family protein [Pontibacter liquoris]|uniref:outer membrane beta-barrel family protein n=1 Tax=Pontibacter liquoris TaxID=2905677 RepID=UPI001FA7A4D8|nr:outer membrane beta-barrel family protein [Pontibacter liquoris]
MKKMYFLFALLLVCCSTLVQAQSDVMLRGKAIAESGEPVGFANVAVLDAATGNVVTGAIADLEGRFQIKTPAVGKYKLKLNGLGYLETLTPVFEVTGVAFSKDFGPLQLKADVKTLREVQIQTLRPTVTTAPDKMVVSVENTAMAEGSTAYDVLTKSPGVWVDKDGNIQLNGKGGVQVMLNGRRSYLSGKELQNLLQSMSAENLKDLEIITNPSARFDAEGASGIININLKKAQTSGLNGSVYGGYQYNRLSTFTSGAEISHKAGNWNSFGSINLNRRMNYRNMKMDRVFMNESGTTLFNQDGYEEGDLLEPSLRLGTDYDLNKRHSVGMMANVTANRERMSFNTESFLRNENNLFIDARNQSDSKYGNGTFNVHYLGKLDTTGTTLSADLDFVHISNTDEASFRNRYIYLNTSRPDSVEQLRNKNPTNYDIYSGKLDFTRQLGSKTKLELGAKASHVRSDNELRFFEVQDAVSVPDARRSNHFVYTENIVAAYASLSATLSAKWSLQAGLRAEQTESSGKSLTKNEKTDRSYLDLFPTLFVQQKVNDDYQLSYKYSRRINRPYYGHLNPFLFFLDPYTSAQGNPLLKPQYINSVEMTHTLKQKYNLVLGYAYTKNYIAEVPAQNAETNTTVYQKQNVKNLQTATATLVAPIHVSDKWEISNNVTGLYQQYTTLTQGSVVVLDQFSVIAATGHTVLLPHGMRLEVNANYQGPLVYGIYQVQDQWWVDAGLKRSFLNDKLSLSLNVNDIFKTQVLKVQTELNGNVNAIDQYQGQQSVRLNLRYRFSRGAAFEARKRNTNLEELNRTGGK